MNRLLSICLILLLSFSLSSALIAEEEEKEKRGPKEGYGGLMLGGLYTDMAELNSAFSRHNITNLNDTNFTIGGFGYGLIAEKVVIGGEVGGFWQSVDSEQLKAKLTGVEALFDIGYVVLKWQDMKIFPLVGAGFGVYQLKFTPAIITPTFDQLLDDARQYSSIRLQSLVMKISLGVDKFIKVGKTRSNGAERGLLLGVRLGYSWMPRSSDWKMRQIEILNSPRTSFGGYFFNIVIGGGGKG